MMPYIFSLCIVRQGVMSVGFNGTLGGFLMVSRFVMFNGIHVMLRRFFMMFCSLFVIFNSFLILYRRAI